jgi:Protein of unknown function (DUF3179)
MMLTLFILLATASAAAVSLGGDPRWMLCPRGLEVILLSRWLQWPLMVLSLIACAAVCVSVIAGGRRVWWLMALVPVLGLFVHRFVTDPALGWQVYTDAAFVDAGQATFVGGRDEVVGLELDGQAYAYPYCILYPNPVVEQARPQRRLVLFWSAFANRAVAATVSWNIQPRALQVVGEPANALLVYNREVGQFINGLTGLTPHGRRPTGFGPALPTVKMTWDAWRKLHPLTKVLRPPAGWKPIWPTQPVAPLYPMPATAGMPAQVPPGTPAALMLTPRPLIVPEADVTAAPLNLLVDSDPLLVFRDGRGLIRAFTRRIDGDLTPRFYRLADSGRDGAVLAEQDSGSDWTGNGLAVAGPLKGVKLRPIVVDDGVYLNVIRYWYPSAQIIRPAPQDVQQAPAPPPRRLWDRRIRGRRRRTVTTLF